MSARITALTAAWNLPAADYCLARDLYSVVSDLLGKLQTDPLQPLQREIWLAGLLSYCARILYCLRC